MEKLWSSYIDGNLSLSITMKEAYASTYDVKSEWLSMTEETVGDYVQRIVSELQLAGYDLDTTDIKILQEKFISAEVIINTPTPYIELSNALFEIKKQIEESAANECPEFIVTKLLEIKEKIEYQLATMR